LKHWSENDSVDEYQDVALRFWVPEPDNQADSAAAAIKLAKLLQKQNGDTWMMDFLRARRAGDSPALLALGQAITDNLQGRHHEAQNQASIAAAIFQRLNNKPGILRARFEEAYADQRLLQANSCLNTISSLETEAISTNYQWLRTQLTLEHAICLRLQGKVRAAQEQMERALRSADEFDFHVLRLRAYALDAAMQVDNNCGETWKKAHQGLDLYGQGQALPQLEYGLISPIKQCFEKRGLWSSAEALQQRMLKIQSEEIDPDDRNLLFQITGYESLAQIERELGKEDEARKATARANELIHQVDKSIAAIFTIPPRLKLAELQMDDGNLPASLATIQEVEKDRERIDTKFFDLAFFTRSAEVRFAMGQTNESAKDYQRAIEVAENQLAEYTTEGERQRWMIEAADAYNGLAALWTEQKRTEEAAKLLEWYKGRALEDLSAAPQKMRTVQWQDLEGAILNQSLPMGPAPRLIYFTTRNRMYVLTLRNSGIESASVDVRRAKLRQMVLEFVRYCSLRLEPDSDLPVSEAQSRELYLTFLKPVMERLHGNETVTVEHDFALKDLLLEAFMDQHGRYFAEMHPVIYSPGYVWENRLRQPVQGPPRRALGINSLDPEGGQKSLAQNDFEESYPAMELIDGTNLVAGDLPGLLKSTDLFAYFGHAGKGKLYAMDKTVLTAEDFPPQSLDSLQLVILAACSSASGANSSGWNVSIDGDVSSLVHTFHSGGTPQVIASHWDVNEKATVDLMSSLLRHLYAGETAPVALFHARKEMILQRKYRHPHVWAPFTLNGRAAGNF
jgi:CHAT domain-containing protein